MKGYNPKNLPVILILAFFCLAAIPVKAATPGQKIELSPAVFRLSLSPGQQYQETIKIRNLSGTAIPIRATLESLLPSDDEIPSTEITPEREEIIDWIRIEPLDTIISASASTEFSVSVSIPATVPVGGYGAMITFSPLVRQDTLTTGSSRIIPRLGAIILANVGIPEPLPPDKKAAIGQLILSPGEYPDTITVKMDLKNTSRNFFSAKPSLKLTPILSKNPTEILLTEKTVFPGRTRLWSESRPLPTGIYRTIMSVSLGNGEMISRSSIAIIIPPAIFGFILVIIISLTFTFVFGRKIPGAVRTLLTGK